MLLEHPGSSCQNAGNFSRYSSGQGKTVIPLTSLLIFILFINLFFNSEQDKKAVLSFNWRPGVR